MGGSELDHFTMRIRQQLLQTTLGSCVLPGSHNGIKAIIPSVKERASGPVMGYADCASTNLQSTGRDLDFLFACCMTGINFSKVAERKNQEIFEAALLHLTGDFQQLRDFILSNSTDLNGVHARRCAISVRGIQGPGQRSTPTGFAMTMHCIQHHTVGDEASMAIDVLMAGQTFRSRRNRDGRRVDMHYKCA
jgi:hypothetical protein